MLLYCEQVLGAYENVFFSHSTWFVYQSMNRIYKYYDLNVNMFSSKKISFSSYPGMFPITSCHIRYVFSLRLV